MSVIYISVSGQIVSSVYKDEMYLFVIMVSAIRPEWISSRMRSNTAMQVSVLSDHTCMCVPTEIPCLLRTCSREVNIPFFGFRNHRSTIRCNSSPSAR